MSTMVPVKSQGIDETAAVGIHSVVDTWPGKAGGMWPSFVGSIAVTIITATSFPAHAQANKPDDAFRLIRVQCPEINDNVLQVISKSGSGESLRVRMHMGILEGQGEKAVRIEIFERDSRNASWSPSHDFDLLRRLSAADEVTADKALRLAAAVLRHFCRGDDKEKARLEAHMRTNRNLVGE